MAVVNLIVVDQSGNQAVVGRHLFNGANRGCVPREFALEQLEGLEDFESGPYNTAGYTVKVEVVPATGQRFIIADFVLK